jgi:hypothetical protein
VETKAVDVILVGRQWPDRALVRAQLIEEGYDVIASDVWPIQGFYRGAGTNPRLLLIDLHGLPDPRQTLSEVALVSPPDRVLVVTALGTVPPDEVRRLGFTVIERPVTVGQVVAAVRALLAGKRNELGNWGAGELGSWGTGELGSWGAGELDRNPRGESFFL